MHDLRRELESVHDNLLAWMASLDDLTCQDRCRAGQLETVRWFLSRARRDRRLLLERILNDLSSSAGPAEVDQLQQLRLLLRRTIEAGSIHVAKWTLAAVEADWDGYRTETKAMRQLWADSIAAEKKLLSALLGSGAPTTQSCSSLASCGGS